MMEFGCLQTKRLTLRPPLPEDHAFAHALVADTAVRRYLGGPSDDPYRGNAARWIVVHDAPIGMLSLGRHRSGIEVSYQFMPRNWGQGFAAEAVGALCAEAREYFEGRCRDGAGKEDVDLTRTPIVAETQAANMRSRRLLERIGFRETDAFERFGALQILYTLM